MAPATAAATTAAEAISGPEPPELPESSELSPEVAPVGASPASRRAASEVLSGALLDGLADAWPEACALALAAWPEMSALGRCASAEPCELLDAVAPLLAELASRPELWPWLFCEPLLELPCEPLPALLFEPLVEPLFELPPDVPEVGLVVAFEVGLAAALEGAGGVQDGALAPAGNWT